jgi:hypothetical protein
MLVTTYRGGDMAQYLSEEERHAWTFIKAVAWLWWFVVRIAWWLAVLVVLSIGAGIVGLVRLARPKADDTAGFGRYSDDRRLWLDEGNGQQYPVSDTETEYCEVEADQTGMYWRRTAVSRLLRGGAIVRYKFYAISTGGQDAEPTIAAEEEFPQEARRNITLDHLDPAKAAEDPYGLDGHRKLAGEALDVMDLLLTRRGWERVTDEEKIAHGQHWYSRVYKRPAIRWSEPVPAISATLGDAS